MAGTKSDSTTIQPATLGSTSRWSPPWNWIEAASLGLLALIGVDALLSVVLGVGVDVVSSFMDNQGSLLRLIEDQAVTTNFAFYATSRLLGLWLVWLFVKKRGLGLKDLGFRKFKLFKALAMVAAASLILLAVTTAVLYAAEKVLPHLNWEEEQHIVFTEASTLPETVLAFIALVLIAPIVEETVFRGFMLPAFAKRFGIILGAVATSLLFGLIHWQLNVSIITFIMGLLLSWLYVRNNSLYPAIMFHSLKNLVAFWLIF